MQELEKYEKYLNKKEFTIRGFLIALCMGFYDWRYLLIGNLKERLLVIHIYTDYIQVKAPILKAAKHCAYHWTLTIIDNQLPDTFEGIEKAKRYYKL